MKFFKSIFGVKGIHYLTTRLGTRHMKQKAYDAKYESGEWAEYAEKISDELVHIIETYCAGGNICVLGCGAGGLAKHLDKNSYSQFLGIDLSETAIQLAKKYENKKIQFVVADITNYQLNNKFKVIVYEECLNYINPIIRKKVIQNHLASLQSGGVIIITIADSIRYKNILDELRHNFNLIEDRTFGQSIRQLMIIGK